MEYKWDVEVKGERKYPVYDPRNYEADRKRQWQMSGAEFICRCAPGLDLRYYFAGAKQGKLIFRPKRGNIAGSHARDCKFNEEYLSIIRPRNPIKKDEETGDLKASVFENVSGRPERSMRVVDKPLNKVWKPGDPSKARPTTMSELIRTLNLDNAERLATNFQMNKKPFDSFNRWIFASARTVEDTAHGRMINENFFGKGRYADRVKHAEDTFFYEQLTDILFKRTDVWESVFAEGMTLDGITSLIDMGAKRWKITTRHTERKKDSDKTEELKEVRPVTADAIKYAVKSFKGIYNGTNVFRPDRVKIIATGYMYVLNKGWPPMIDRLWLMKVSKGGIYCESDYEAEAISAIEDLTDRTDEIRFYKPGRFGSTGAYGIGNFIEDGVLVGQGCKKTGIIEVFGIKGSPAYNERKKWKAQQIEKEKDRYIFIPWDVTNESLAMFRGRVEKAIEEIKASSK